MRVIAKAYGDEPIVRDVIFSNKRLAYLVKNDDDSPVVDDGVSGVGFPLDCIFRFDGALVTDLESAWESGNHRRLAELWSIAEQWTDS